MRKFLILLLSLIPVKLMAAGAGGINLTPDPKALLRSTSTWTGSQTFVATTTFIGAITVPSCVGCSAGGGHTIQDEGISQTQRTNLNFVGAGVTVTDDSGNNATKVTIPSGGSGGSDNMGSHFATTTVQMAGQAVIGSSQVLVGVSTGLATIVVSSPTASILWDIIRVDTGAATPLWDLQRASMTLAAPTTPYFLSDSFVQGSTISAQTQDNFNQSYIARYGPMKNGPTASSLQVGFFPYLYTSLGTITKIGFMNNGGGVLEWGLTTGPFGLIGTLTHNALQIRINVTELMRWDTNGNVVGAGGAATQKVIIGYTNVFSSGVYTSSVAAYAGVTSTTGFTGGGATFTWVNDSGQLIVAGTTTLNGNLVTNSSNSFQSVSSMSLTNVTLQMFSTNKYYMTMATTTAPGTMYKVAITSNGVITSSGVAPALSSCGTSPTVVGNDRLMIVTVGAAATGCTITFNTPFFNKPACWLNEETGSITNALTQTISNTAITLSQVGLAGNVVHIGCGGLGE